MKSILLVDLKELEAGSIQAYKEETRAGSRQVGLERLHCEEQEMLEKSLNKARSSRVTEWALDSES